MNKTMLRIMILTICILIFPKTLVAEEELPEQDEHEVEETLYEFVKVDELENQWKETLNEYRNYLPLDHQTTWRDFVEGASLLSLSDWGKGFVLFFLEEWVNNGKTIGILIFLTLLSVFLKLLIESFERDAVANVSYMVIFGVLITVAIASFNQAISYATTTIDTMGQFMIALLPLYLSLMAAFGNITSVGFFQPFLLFFTQFSSLFISKLIIPLFFLSAILHIANEMNQTHDISKLAYLFRQIAFWLMGGFLSIFMFVISLQGGAAATADGLAIRAAKFVTSNFIPVIGRVFTEATDTVLSTSILLKNAIGLASVVMIIIITIFPAIKILVLGLMFRVTAALLQPVADGPVIAVIDWMGKHILYILVALLIVSIMFFFAIVILIIVGNATLMIR
ncbi:stage III sporulation protein AE [Halalkalibacillus halophilus]|uniref:stage III sporulation protein AE n=1 Tax=Halalkalibacillus halophilus TaxID=392827 RepID=UPI000422DE65|nr:stage III sporulation protein AE [Halalkalibacillus halophilus]